MRILAITNLYPRLGHETFAAFNRQQFRALAVEHDLRVIAPVPWTLAWADWRHGTQRLRGSANRDGVWVDHPLFWFPPRIMRHHYGWWFAKSIAASVERSIEDFSPQVILGCWAHPDGWAAVHFGKKYKIPVVVKVHGSDVLVAGKEPRRRKVMAGGLAQADAIVCVGDHLAGQIERLGVDARRVHVVHHGIHAEQFKRGDKRAAKRSVGLDEATPMLLFVGNMLRSKGAGLFLQACAKLKATDVPFRASLIGKGGEETELRGLAKQLGLESDVRFEGVKPQEELPAWYQAADLTVLPSFSEGIPNVLRESLACGTPFVATRVGGIPELEDPSWCRLVPVGDLEVLTDTIRDLLARPLDVDAGLFGRRVISWRESARLLAQILQDRVDERATHLRDAVEVEACR